MPAVGVVVPVYQVEEYVQECLESIARQSLRDLEVVVVDDGSTDASADIARAFAARDGRFRVVSQPNRGLGAARNAGLEQVTADAVAFVDSDDVLPHDALALLHASLERTGSDFATGMVHRYDGERSWPAPWLRKAFSRSRARTHVTRFPWLVTDRTAWNKLWRRAFLDEHGLRFAEGVFNEDIPMVLPAHYLARSVDVIARPVYHWRTGREGSITARRLQLRMLTDRLAAIETVCDFLDERFPAHARTYYESVVEEDLRYHLDVLDEADDEYRRVFMERAQAFLARAPAGVEDKLPAIQRLKWHLVRRGLLDEAIEVVRFQKGGLGQRTLRAGRVYGAYPYLDDPRLGIPRSVYRLDTTRRRLRHARTLLR